MTKRTVIIGVGGPVGSGKTLCLSVLTTYVRLKFSSYY